MAAKCPVVFILQSQFYYYRLNTSLYFFTALIRCFRYEDAWESVWLPILISVRQTNEDTLELVMIRVLEPLFTKRFWRLSKYRTESEQFQDEVKQPPHN